MPLRLTTAVLATLIAAGSVALCFAKDLPAGKPVQPIGATPDLDITGASIQHFADYGVLVFEMNVASLAGQTIPTPAGSVDSAPVLGYVFPTTLDSIDVGFGEVEGVVALAITSHPDFDDTPLFDEDADRNYGNDGVVWHPHWVVLVPDDRVAGGLSVRQFEDASQVTLPPTNPGMPMYMDSPGFAVTTVGDTLRVVVPTYRVSGQTDFNFDAVTAYMQVNTSDDTRPMLGVYSVYDVLSGDLSLPQQVTQGH